MSIQELSVEDGKILVTSAADLKTDEKLFRKYELSFDQRRFEGMIDVKKEWRRRGRKDFHRAYAKRVK